MAAQDEATNRSGAAAQKPDLWVFAYGSLMWFSGFAYEEAVRATLTGWRRCFCIYSVHYRGTPQRPGMVLGLDRGGACTGIAYRIRPEDRAATLAYLRKREQVTGVYREALVPVTLHTARHEEVLAVAYLVERAHPSYAGRLPIGVQARLILRGRGLSGVNLDYFVNTYANLAELRIAEPEFRRLMTLAGPLLANGSSPAQLRARAQAMCRAHERRSFRCRFKRMRMDQRVRFIWRKKAGAVSA